MRQAERLSAWKNLLMTAFGSLLIAALVQFSPVDAAYFDTKDDTQNMTEEQVAFAARFRSHRIAMVSAP